MFVTNQEWVDRIAGDAFNKSDGTRWISFEADEIILGNPDENHAERLHRYIQRTDNLIEADRLTGLEEALLEAFPNLSPNTSTVVRCAYNVPRGSWQLDINQHGDGDTPGFMTCSGGERARKVAETARNVSALASYLGTHNDPALSEVYHSYLDLSFDEAVMEGEVTATQPYLDMLKIAFDTYATRDFAPVRDVCPEWDGMDEETKGAWLAEHVGSIVGASFAQMEESLQQPGAGERELG